MKQAFTFSVCVAMAMAAMAQEAASDSLTHELGEIVIEAPKVIQRADMNIYYPAKSAVNISSNGLQLLNNLMIPSLTVSEVLGTVQAAGEPVQVRINGRESTISQVRALLPETIKRVEWVDNPGLRYGGANYVLNFIVANPTLGGSLMLSATPSLNQAWGDYMADAKFNVGRSQWSVGGNFRLNDKTKAYRDYTEKFTFPDGNSLTRNESPLGGEVDDSHGDYHASYSYVKPDTTVFMAELALHQSLGERMKYNGLLSLSNDDDDILLQDVKGSEGNSPKLSLYWQQNFRDRQVLVVNFNSSLYFGRSYSDYIETKAGSMSDAAPMTDIHTNIKDRNQAYALETDYIKSWRTARLSAGISYTANRNRSEYEYLDGAVFHQRQDKVYLFAEYYRRFGKWTATAGLGIQYTEFRFRESDQGNRSWSPRPQATLTYSLNQNHNFRLNFTSWQSAPSLAETNVVAQQLDGFQWRLGNPNLKTSDSYMLTFQYRFNLPRLNGSFGVRGYSSPNAITPLLFWDDNRLITTYENSRGLRNLSFFLAPQIEVIPGWLTANGYLQFRMERMRGTGYDLRNNAWSGSAMIMLTHWGFSLSAQYMRSQRDLWGEKISWGEDINVIDLSYNLKGWQFGAGVFMPLGKYDQGSKSISKWNCNEQHLRLGMRMPYIKIAYNFQWGRQKRSARKLINTDANADRSTAGGR